MIKIVVSIFIIFMSVGCTDKSLFQIDIDKEIPKASTSKAAEFILTCAKNANPLSDEEGEDLVKQCQYTAVELFGEKEFYFCYSPNRWCAANTKVHCSNASTPIEAQGCASAGFKEIK